MPSEDSKRAAHRALVDRILSGPGEAATGDRARAFANDGLPAPLDALIGKVVARPVQVTDAEFSTARAAGVSEAALFELVVCAAVGHSSRLYAAGLAALAEATGEGER